ncbi:MAG: GNAT family N-acetyltransferase, partial [Actinobacteria bacterium]|nr:GNAT family N-acetyltransferase [Actinomycetota bacterium]
RGYTRVSLETGTGPAFEAGHALYARAGFTRCPPFAQYWDNPYSVCMTIEL